jgi:hypothetical protein
MCEARGRPNLDVGAVVRVKVCARLCCAVVQHHQTDQGGQSLLFDIWVGGLKATAARPSKTFGRKVMGMASTAVSVCVAEPDFLVAHAKELVDSGKW